MDNQHKQIKGYRDLSQAEIDLINAIKAKGAELIGLTETLGLHLMEQHSELRSAPDAEAELRRFEAAEPYHWHSIGRTDIQTGIMALVRAVAQPTTY